MYSASYELEMGADILLDKLFGAFLIYSVGIVTGLLVFPLMVRVLLKMLQKRMKK